MRYILLSDFDSAEEIDDAMYLIPCRETEETANTAEATPSVNEPFTVGDVYRIRKKAPADADSIAMTDDWMYYNKESGMLFDYVFKS